MATGQMLQDYLAGPVMSQLLASDDIRRGVPDVYPPELMKKSDTEVVGMQVMWDAYTGSRTAANLVNHMSPSKRVEQPGVIRRFGTALGSRENWIMDYEFLQAMKSNIPLYVQRAKDIFMDRMRNFRVRFDTLQNAMVGSAFSQGAIYSNSNGAILPNATGMIETANFNLNYGGSNALNKNSAYPNITPTVTVGDWSNTGTDIPSSLRALRQSHIFTSNYNPKTIMYGRAIPGYFYNNVSMQTYLSRQPQLNDKFMSTNEVPMGLLDYNWVPCYDAYYVDASGNVQKWWADNQIVVIPEVTDEWYEFFEASVLVPNTLVPPGFSVEQLIGACSPVKGYASYVEMMTDPIACKTIASWYGLPTLKNPNLVWSIITS